MNRFSDYTWVKYLVFLALFLAGLFAGVLIRDFPYLSLDKQVSVSDLTSLLLTIIVSIWIPISLSPIITDKRSIKDFLMDETRGCLEFLIDIKKDIDNCALTGTTSENDRKRINSMISRDLALKISSLVSQLSLSFKGRSGELRNSIADSYREYWQESTGGSLMAAGFKFNMSYCMQHDRCYAKLEASLKKAIHEINSY